MQKQTNNSGIYILELFSKDTFKIQYPKFNYKYFPAGFYYYVGSAQRNLKQRVHRHFNNSKKKHWHIDYLTDNKTIRLKKAYIIKQIGKEYECRVVKDLIEELKLEVKIKKFGNSDCNNCDSHLLYKEKPLSHNHLCSLYQSTVLFIPSSNEIVWE